jgi:hypothetical protein
MSTAVGSLADLAYVEEETYATIPPSPAFKKLRRVSTSLNLKKDVYESQEIRTNRMTSDLRHGVRHPGGDVVGELAVGSYDDFFQGLMGGTWTAGITLTNTDLTSVTSNGGAKTFIFTGGNPITLGLKKGDVIQFSTLAASGNNAKNFTILSFGGTNNRTITVAETVVTDAIADSSFSLTVVGKKLNIGNTYRSYVMERAYTDIAQYQVFTGCRINTAAFNLPPTGIAGITFGIVAKDMNALSTTSLDSAYTDASTNSPLAAVDGALIENGITLATVTGLTLNVNNNLGGKPVVGHNTIQDQLFGNRAQVTGQLTVVFQDAVLFNKFVNETESSLFVKINDPNGTDFFKIYLPRIKYTGGDIGDADPTGLPITMPFTALDPNGASGDNASSICFQRSNS